MHVGVGLPATLPGARGRLIIEWAQRAETGPFTSLGVLDRVLYDSYEPLTALAAAAAVTERITLAATVIIAPLRSAAGLAKQAATVNALSGNRLVLGVGLGARRDDYDVTHSPYRTRGQHLTDMLVEMRDCWERQLVGPSATPPPRLLVGGAGGIAALRMARHAHGYVHGGGPPRAFARAAAEALSAWEDVERPGKPELWGMAYFALGGMRSQGVAYLRDYYAFTGAFADKIASGLVSSRDELLELIDGYRDAGCSQLNLFPTVPAITQLDELINALAA